MSLSHKNGIALTGLSSINGVTSISAYNGISATLGGGGTPAWTWSTGTVTGDVGVDTSYVNWNGVDLPAGTATKLGIYISQYSYTGNIKLLLFNGAGTLLATGTTSVTVTGDAEVNISSTVLSAATYQIMMIGDSTGALQAGKDSVGTRSYKGGYSYGSPPSSLPTADGTDTGIMRVGAYITP